MEREWCYRIFIEVTEALKEECGADFIDRIQAIVKMSQTNSAAMISSYSLNGDVLSQWRAYADDGRGFAIGFSTRDMDMPAETAKVLYDRAAQIKELTGNIRHVFQHERSIGFKYNDEFLAHWYTLGLDLCAYKNPAFARKGLYTELLPTLTIEAVTATSPATVMVTALYSFREMCLATVEIDFPLSLSTSLSAKSLA